MTKKNEEKKVEKKATGFGAKKEEKKTDAYTQAIEAANNFIDNTLEK